MEPIEFSIPVCFEDVVLILGRISKGSFFEFEPDRMRKSTTRNVTYQILIRHEEHQKPEFMGLFEMTRKKENVTIVKISGRYSSQSKTLPETGSPFTRFVGLLTQDLISQGLLEQAR